MLDASTLVSASIAKGSVPDKAVRHAFAADRVAVSEAMMTELLDVLARPRLARFIKPELRDEVLSLLDTYGVLFAPLDRIADCRDPKDDKYLELAIASGARVIVSGDDDLLALDPWRGVRILTSAGYLAQAEPTP